MQIEWGQASPMLIGGQGFSSPTPMMMAIKIKDGIFVGNMYASQDEEFMFTNKVTHIINCAAQDVPNLFSEMGCKYLSFSWRDSPSTIVLDSKDNNIKKIVSFIDHATQEGECVLIHSVLGVSRACVVAAAYFIYKYSWSLTDTLNFLEISHPDMKIKPDLLRQLREFSKRQRNTRNNSSADSEESQLLRNTFMNSIPADHNINSTKSSNFSRRKVSFDANSIHKEKSFATFPKSCLKKITSESETESNDNNPPKHAPSPVSFDKGLPDPDKIKSQGSSKGDVNNSPILKRRPPTPVKLNEEKETKKGRETKQKVEKKEKKEKKEKNQDLTKNNTKNEITSKRVNSLSKKDHVPVLDGRNTTLTKNRNNSKHERNQHSSSLSKETLMSMIENVRTLTSDSSSRRTSARRSRKPSREQRPASKERRPSYLSGTISSTNKHTTGKMKRSSSTSSLDEMSSTTSLSSIGSFDEDSRRKSRNKKRKSGTKVYHPTKSFLQKQKRG